ncbi:MAG: hypothetical protein IJX63_12480 [Lachnospiraceae bacterium]|nr:hypothetical protein [Lachnospiraceae bacterium]
MRQFCEVYPKWNAVRSELSWTHYRLLMRIKEDEKREYYMQECIQNLLYIFLLKTVLSALHFLKIKIL